MTAFMQNVLRHRALNKALKPHGLKLSSGVVLDTTLPAYMHSIVCGLDHKHLALGKPFEPMAHSEIALYLSGGREAKIASFKQAQANARAWANRPTVRDEVDACQ
ncbi:TPA: hypothetical protein ACSCYS_004268 [Aeromonas veronii]